MPEKSETLIVMVCWKIDKPVTMNCVGIDFHAEMISAVYTNGAGFPPVRVLIPEEQMIAVMDVRPYDKGPEPAPDKIFRAFMPGLQVDLHRDTLARCGRYGPLECLGRRGDAIVRMLLGPRYVSAICPPDDSALEPIRIRRGPELWPEYRG
jgi:hypothetical protein